MTSTALLNAPRLSSGATATAGAPVLEAGNAHAANESAALAMLRASDFDATNPEAVFAFFQTQMKDTRGRLGEMMTAQEQRNARVKTLQSASAKVAAFQEKPITPADPKWNDFVAACNELKSALVPGTKEFDEITKAIELATTGVEQRQGPEPFQNAAAAAAANRGVIVDAKGAVVDFSDGTSDAKYTAVWSTAPGASAEVIKGMVNQVKAQTDGLQTESTMTMIRIQSLVDACSQITNLCSNVLKKLSDAQNTAIGNIR